MAHSEKEKINSVVVKIPRDFWFGDYPAKKRIKKTKEKEKSK